MPLPRGLGPKTLFWAESSYRSHKPRTLAPIFTKSFLNQNYTMNLMNSSNVVT